MLLAVEIPNFVLGLILGIVIGIVGWVILVGYFMPSNTEQQ